MVRRQKPSSISLDNLDNLSIVQMIIGLVAKICLTNLIEKSCNYLSSVGVYAAACNRKLLFSMNFIGRKKNDIRKKTFWVFFSTSRFQKEKSEISIK